MKIPPWLWVSALILGLGLMTTALHLTWIARSNPERRAYLESGKQFQYHEVVIAGEAGNPWQYRILAPFLLEGIFHLSDNPPIALIFIAFRSVQNIAIFALSYVFYARLGYCIEIRLLGLSMVLWGMVMAAYDSDLAFNTYFDLIFYLVAALLIWDERWTWLIPLTALAALNRETSGMIPILAALTLWFYHRQKQGFAPLALALLSYFAVFIALRLHYGNRPADSPAPGLEALIFNLTDLRGWVLLGATLGLTPLLAIFSWRFWHPRLQIWGLALLPLWFVVHLGGGIIAETRLFLVPYVLILVPASLAGLKFSSK